jgi:large subunit ribosomal protein L43
VHGYLSLMARNGVWQLKKLTVNYCDWGGSSRGARDFLQRILPSFKVHNPQLDIAAQVKRGQHPHLTAEYANRSQRVVDMKNKEPEQILEHSLRLRGSAGRKTSHRVRKRHITQQPSVQGEWTSHQQTGSTAAQHAS